MSSADGDERGDHLVGMAPLAPGDPQRIGPYLLLGRLGAGGMGRVYLARSAGGRTVAVKVVHEEHASSEQFRARFRREIDAARRVGERHTAPVLDADPDAEAPWVATGYVPGPSLEQVVRQYGPLPADSVRALAQGLLRALKDIHAAGIVHRDLKPSNVMLTVEGPRVIDFGIARALDASVESLLTSTGMVIGSPGFMSPEQIRGRRVGPASDVFTLGCVLMYAATGLLPFGRGVSNQHAVMYQIVEGEPDLAAVRDEPLRTLVERCLTKEADRRPSVEELLRSADGMSPAESGGGWLPAELVADIAQQAARLLDAEASGLREEDDAHDPRSGADPRPGAEEAPPAPRPPDRSTVGLRPKGAGPERAGEAEPKPPGDRTPDPSADQAPDRTPDKRPERTPGRERRPRRPVVIGIAVVAVVTVGGGAITLLPHIGKPQAASPDHSRSAEPPGSGTSSASGSPSAAPSKTRAAKKPKGSAEDKGKGEDTAGDSGPAAGQGGAGSAGGGDSDDGRTDSSDSTTGTGTADSGGTSTSGGGSRPAPKPTADGSQVPSYFVGTWNLTAQYSQQPGKVVIYRARTGENAVRLINDTVGHCENVAKLVSVTDGGRRINIGTAVVDEPRSPSVCADMDPSSFLVDDPSGIRHDVGPAHGDGYHYERSG